MSNTADKNDEKKAELEHKVGLHDYARVGENNADYVIVGAPNVRGKRWITATHKWGGPLVSYPETEFLIHFWVPNPTEK
jgi:hypothetical protein